MTDDSSPVEPARKLQIVIASGTSITNVTPESLKDKPVQDYAILGRLYDATFVDPLVADTSRVERLLARFLGTAWSVAYRAVVAGRRAPVMLAMGDDVGIPMTAFKRLLLVRTPLIMISWHMRSKRARLLIGKLRLHRQVGVFLSASAKQRRVLVEEYRVPWDKVVVVGTAVDHRYFSMDPSIPVRRQIASAGTAARDYGTLIEASKDLDVDVKIEASSAWYNMDLSVRLEGLPDRITFSNDGTTLGLRSIYAESQIVVVPLHAVNFSAGDSTIVEAMSMGKPVVASAIEMLGDYIVDGENGVLVPPEDPAALREELRSLLNDPARCEQLGRAARQTIEESYTRDRFAQVVQDAVTRVLEPR